MLKFTNQQILTVRRSNTAKLQEHLPEIFRQMFPLRAFRFICYARFLFSALYKPEQAALATKALIKSPIMKIIKVAAAVESGMPVSKL